MGATLEQSYGTSTRSAVAGSFVASFPKPDPVSVAPEAPATGVYGARRGPNLLAIATILLLHAAALLALISFDVIPIRKAAREPLVIDLLAEPPLPPPAAPPESKPLPVKAVQPEIVAPKPLVQVSVSTPPPVAVTATPAPPKATIVTAAPAAPTQVTRAPVAVDLSSKMIAGKPPRYPVESRRKREQGIVVLRVLVDMGGNAEEVSVARSSGFDRLDTAALDAVRRWRWSPTVQDGAPVKVRGTVEIPFVLKG